MADLAYRFTAPRPGLGVALRREPLELTKRVKRSRSAFKRFIYSQLNLRDAILIALGRTPPLVHFKVEADPPSVYFNFEIRADKVEEFQRAVDLPMPMCPMTFLEDDEPYYGLTLNMYRVSGLAVGKRAEWSAYVRDAEDIPRYLVVEARSDSGSVDPVNGITRGCDLAYDKEGGALNFRVLSERGGYFNATCNAPGSGKVVRAAPEWVQANDYIYWLNGICDRTFYDSGLANARARLLDPATVEVSDDTWWSQWLVPEPRQVVVFDDAIEFAMSPWWNLKDL